MRNQRSPTKFYQEDIVQHVDNPDSFGIILRCWYDAEEVVPDGPLADPMMRELQPDEVGVSFFPSGKRDILPESQFLLVDRTFQPGDYCKRSIDDVRSGVVISVEVTACLEHAISRERVNEWKSKEDIETSTDVEVGSYVIYDDWVGQVIELFDESVIESINGQLVRLPELSSRLTVGDKGDDILPPPLALQNLFGLSNYNRPSGGDTVIAVKHTVIAVCWLALNQYLDHHESQARKRPQRFWYGEDLSKLIRVRSNSDKDMRVGDKVTLKNSAHLPYSTHGREGDPAGLLAVRSFVVKETRTAVSVLWQDGAQEVLSSTELIPHLNPDEYDCWPGDHVLWKSEDVQRTAIVQSVDANERTATILFKDTGTTGLVSVLELDPHGSMDISAAMANPNSEGLGVHRGDYVFIHREGTTNGLSNSRVPRIGEVENWAREAPTDLDGQISGWRKEMCDIGFGIATRRAADAINEGDVRYLSPEDRAVPWFGEVTGIMLDGMVEVTGLDLTVALYPLERLTKLYDGLQQLDDGIFDDEHQDEQGSYLSHGEMWQDEDGVWHQATSAGSAEWEEVDDDDANNAMDVDPGWDVEQNTHSTADESASVLNGHTTTSEVAPIVRTPSPSQTYMDQTGNHEVGDGQHQHWRRFAMLSSAPPDHAFYGTSPSQPSKSFLSRLSKEYQVLESSLPDSILVRAYEDRTDLLRCLIIGPENTPYEDAPFVIDWMLDSNFPHSPPIAHFLSWTNGNGRVNPNLYEEGKVCLSILGTWAGDQNETWSAARSSLMQALVSIQGLVLVKEPWFCEPAYERLRGTEQGVVNSRLYNEKAYVLSRGFVRRALEVPLGGLEDEVYWMYYTNRRLHKVVSSALALIQKSKVQDSSHSEEDLDLAVPRLTGGGIITLDRTLNKLQGFLDAHISGVA